MSINSVNDRLQEANEDGEYDGYLIGTVVENADPLGINRIKVKVPNLWDPATGEIPWVGPHPYSPFGIGQGFGTYGSPAVGAKVKVYLQDGDAHYGFYESSLYVEADANAKFKPPETWGYKDPAGNELWVNMVTGAFEFTHQAGTTIKHDIEGNLTVHVVKDEITDVQGSVSITVVGNTSVTTQGNTVIATTGDTTVTSGGAVNISGASVNLN